MGMNLALSWAQRYSAADLLASGVAASSARRRRLTGLGCAPDRMRLTWRRWSPIRAEYS